MPTAVTEIAGGAVLEPNPAVVDYLDTKQAKPIPVSVGSIAAGQLWVQKRRDGYDLKAGQSLPLRLPLCDRLRAVGVEPVLAVRSQNGIVEGYASVAGKTGKPGDTDDLFAAIKTNAAVLGWIGVDTLRLPKSQNKFAGSTLTLEVSQLSFSLAGFLHATGSFGFDNEKMRFEATATGKVKGLADIALPISLAPDGTLAGRIEVATKQLAGFTGNVVAAFSGGLVDVRGTVGYRNEKFDGQITIIATDPKSADALVAGQIPGQPKAPIAGPAASDAQGGPAPTAVNPLIPAPGPRVVAGWGNIDVTLADWLSGSALVVVDPIGHVTVVGKITPRMNRPLFEQNNFVYPFPAFPELRASYGIPVVGNVFVYAKVSLSAEARIGPATLTDMEITGTWSTDPKILQNFGLTGTLNVSGFAGLRLTAEGGAGIEILDHDIKAGVEVSALAGIKGYVEAKPTIGYRELQDPLAGKKGEFFIAGHLELAARPFLALSGKMFVKLESPWWSPAPNKTWPWPIGELEYPLPGEFGIGADVEHVLGSGKVPEVKFSEASFDASKFLTDLVDDDVPKKSSTDEQKKGGWKEAVPATAVTPSTSAIPATTPAGRIKPGDKPAAKARDKPSMTPRTARQAKDNVPAPGTLNDWAAFMRVMQELALRSKTDKFTRAEITSALRGVRKKFRFKQLTVEPTGDRWDVHAVMNPDGHFTSIYRATDESATESGKPPPEDRPTHTRPQPKVHKGMEIVHHLAEADSASGIVTDVIFDQRGEWYIKYRPKNQRKKTARYLPAYDSTGKEAFRLARSDASGIDWTGTVFGDQSTHVNARPLVWTTYQKPRVSPRGWDRIAATADWVQAHMVNGKAGGPGAAWNLAIVREPVNKAMSQEFEEDIRTAVKQGDQIWFIADVVYWPDDHSQMILKGSDFPRSITVRFGPIDPSSGVKGGSWSPGTLAFPQTDEIDPRRRTS